MPDGYASHFDYMERVWPAAEVRSGDVVASLREAFSGFIEMRDVEEKTRHRLINGDARDLSFLDDTSVHLVVTSPPYWTLKRYREHPDQLGHTADYESFIDELSKVWRECLSFRVSLSFGSDVLLCR